MGHSTTKLTMLSTLLKLGRVSNLPTVWSNTLAGVVLAGAIGINSTSLLLLLAMTLAYIGGMFLNDAYDVDIDTLERPERPIPAGIIRASTVFILGYGMLFSSIVLVAVTANSLSTSNYAVIAAIALSLCIILYNVWHKQNPLSPLIMGGCRMLVYITAAYTLVPDPNKAVFIGALVTLCYLIGLTYIAKHENSQSRFSAWPIAFLIVPVVFGLSRSVDSLPTLLFTVLFGVWVVYSVQFVLIAAKRNIPKAVVSMIAGISLLDAIYISSAGMTSLAFIAIATFLLTLYLQRHIAGT